MDVRPWAGGATGIAYVEGSYWVIRQAVESSILQLDAEFRVLRCDVLPLSRDAHSLLPYDGGFLIADTLNNRVNHERLAPNGSGFVGSEFWRQHPSNKDETHVNSVCSLGGEVYVSSFGEKPGNAWTSCQTGQIINISTGEIVCDNLQHPHTLATWAGDVYWLESKTGLLHRYTPGGKHQALLHLDGYVRGLAFDADFIYVGASAARRYSRSLGTANKLASGNPDDFCCWIYRVSQKTGAVERRNLTTYGSEIYDLFLVSSVPFEMSQDLSLRATTQRLWRLEDHIREGADAVQSRNAETDRLNCELGALRAELARVKGTKWWRSREILARFASRWRRNG
jgi:hypothetical protein